MKKNHDIIEVEITVLHETEKAYLVTNDGDNKVWLSKSICEIDGSVLQIPEWLALDKGLI